MVLRVPGIQGTDTSQHDDVPEWRIPSHGDEALPRTGTKELDEREIDDESKTQPQEEEAHAPNAKCVRGEGKRMKGWGAT